MLSAVAASSDVAFCPMAAWRPQMDSQCAMSFTSAGCLAAPAEALNSWNVTVKCESPTVCTSTTRSLKANRPSAPVDDSTFS